MFYREASYTYDADGRILSETVHNDGDLYSQIENTSTTQMALSLKRVRSEQGTVVTDTFDMTLRLPIALKQNTTERRIPRCIRLFFVSLARRDRLKHNGPKPPHQCDQSEYSTNSGYKPQPMEPFAREQLYR